MKSAIFSSAIAIFATLATAFPAETAENLVARNQVKQVITSSEVVNIREEAPDIALGISNMATVSRVNNKLNSQALVSFDFPEGLAGYKCQLAFFYPAQFSGTREVQVFTIADANIASAIFNKRPSRDQFKGTFRVTGWDEAIVVDGSGLTFDCPAKGAKAYEVVSVGDNNEVVWYAPWGGLRINVL
ncbi:hypothetical protein L873DRAFT_1787608 [Choiromyces venosus 120613-1]|uniref:Ubiquitin 3 binding protein But2 C-terminal domain-containing protein n=1 Tax=Choiromyces venosus 120613-1 TaxID=1336337 RepID=A0A3N4JWM1_9PEZI|nr:hypothetical protein L873DRAFT_1787608 [Choiromyces venosus 120613-1]